MEAIGLVRTHLGPHAVIVSTQEDDSGTARVPVRPNEIPVNLIYNLAGARSNAACKQNDQNSYRPLHGSQPLPF